MKLQSNLTKKEKWLDGLINEKDRTILEQKRIIRRLLRKSLEEEERSPDSTLSLHTLPDGKKYEFQTIFSLLRKSQ